MEKMITIQQALEYELHTSSWVGIMTNRFTINLIVKYYLFKINRKYKKYYDSMMLGDFLIKNNLIDSHKPM